MKKPLRMLVVVFVLLAVAATAVSAQEKQAWPAYGLSVLLGFGSGHFYLHDKAAVKFLVLDASSAALMVAGGVVVTVSAASALADPASSLDTLGTGVVVGYGLVVVGSLAYTGVRIWEILDIFKTVREQKAEGKVAVQPMFSLTPSGSMVGVSLSY